MTEELLGTSLGRNPGEILTAGCQEGRGENDDDAVHKIGALK